MIVPTRDGYEVAWQNSAADQYVIWDVDDTGHYEHHGRPLGAAAASRSSFSVNLQMTPPRPRAKMPAAACRNGGQHENDDPGGSFVDVGGACHRRGSSRYDAGRWFDVGRP